MHQSIPKIFKDKVAIDKIVTPMIRAKVVNLKEAGEALKQQKTIRRLCEMHCRMNKVDQDGDGAPTAMVA